MKNIFIVFDNNDGRIQVVVETLQDAQRYCDTHEYTYYSEYIVYTYEHSYLTNSQWDDMPKVVPDECYEKYGADLDGCSTQQNEGCGRCKCRDERLDTYSGYDGTFLNIWGDMNELRLLN